MSAQQAPGPTIAGSWEEFKRIVSDFLKAAPTADSDALDAGAKCVGLAYLGIQWDDENRMHTIHRDAGAPALMRIVTRAVVEREIAIAKTNDEWIDAGLTCDPAPDANATGSAT